MLLRGSSRLLLQAGPRLLPAASRQARLLTVAKARQQQQKGGGGGGGKKEGGGELGGCSWLFVSGGSSAGQTPWQLLYRTGQQQQWGCIWMSMRASNTAGSCFARLLRPMPAATTPRSWRRALLAHRDHARDRVQSARQQRGEGAADPGVLGAAGGVPDAGDTQPWGE
jgi:hypothetical protein